MAVFMMKDADTFIFDVAYVHTYAYEQSTDS